LGGIERGRLIEEKVGLWRRSGGSDGGRLVRQLEVEEDGQNDGRIGEEGEDPHLAPTNGTEQRQHLVDPGDELGPTDARGGGRAGGGYRLRGQGSGVGGWRVALGLQGSGPAEGDDGSAELGVGSEDAVVAVTVHARGRDEPGESFEEVEGREDELVTAVDVGLGQAVEKTALGRIEGGIGIEGVQAFERERRPCTIPDEPL